MATLDSRIGKLEVAAQQQIASRKKTIEEERRDQEACVASFGMTWDEMLEKHGGFPAFCFWICTNVPELVGPKLPTKYDGMTPEETYKAMINE